MKKSNYNHILDFDDKKLAFNAISCALAEIDENFEHLYNNIENIIYEDLNNENKELVDAMLQGKYILPDFTDEVALMKYRNYRGKFSNEELTLVIAPTMSCNFGCHYCFESPKQSLMSQDVQDKLVSMVKENAEKKRNISITWYGGEPLLARRIIYSLSERFMEICEEHGVSYNAGMVSNGYLLENSDIELFEKYKINMTQITVDGPEDIHNSRRFLKGNLSEGTFSKIIQNIRMMYDNGINVSVRINVDNNNIEDAKELILYIKDLGMTNLLISLGHVTAYTDTNQNIQDTCLSTSEFSFEYIKLQEFLIANGFRTSEYPFYPGLRANYCGADAINSFVIDPEGYKYKCWNEVGNVSTSVGSIMLEPEDYSEEMIARDIAYMTWNPFDIKTCQECSVLPICMGGCPYTGKRMGEVHCDVWKFNLLEVLKKTYEQKTKA